MMQTTHVTQRNAGLDFLRGIAILLVLVSHALVLNTGIEWIDFTSEIRAQLGGVGVSLFFTLSGFLVGGLLMQEIRETGTVAARRFLVRRAFKIWPGFYALILFHVVIGRHPLETFFWQNFFQVQNYLGSSLPHTWSLAVEEHFYLLLTFCLWWLARKRPNVIVTALLALCMVAWGLRLAAIQAGTFDAAVHHTHCRIDSLLYGVLLAWLRVFKPDAYARLAAQRRVLLVVALAVIPWVLLASGSPALETGIGYTLEGASFCASIVILVERGQRLASYASFRAISKIGFFSYSIYLWHTMVLTPGGMLASFLLRHGVPSSAAALLATTAQVGAALVIGWLMARLIELPFLRLRDRLEPRRKSIAAPSISS